MKNLKIFLMVGMLVFSGALSGCKKLDGVTNQLNRTIDILEDGINTIENESTNWRGTVEDIYDRIPETSDAIIEDARKEVDFLLQDVISSVSAQVQCLVDSAPERILEGLRRTLAKLKETELPPLASCATVCAPNVNIIDLREEPQFYEEIRLNGYDFIDGQIDIDVILVKTSGFTIALQANRFTRQSDYLATISLYNLESTLEQYNTLKVMCGNNVLSEYTIIPD